MSATASNFTILGSVKPTIAPEPADPLSTARPYLQQVLDMTRELFPSGVRCEEVEDAELAGDWSFAITAVSDLPLDQLLKINHEWHRRLSEFPAIAAPFCLSIEKTHE